MVNLKDIRALAALLLSIACTGMSGLMAMQGENLLVGLRAKKNKTGTIAYGAGKNKFLHYTRMPNGRYKLKLEADGVHQEKVVETAADFQGFLDNGAINGIEAALQETNKVIASGTALEQGARVQAARDQAARDQAARDQAAFVEEFGNLDVDTVFRNTPGQNIRTQNARTQAHTAQVHTTQAQAAKDSWFSDSKTDEYNNQAALHNNSVHTKVAHVTDGSNNTQTALDNIIAGVGDIQFRAKLANNCVRLNKAEIFTAVGSLAVFELSQALKGKKAITVRMLAEILSLANDGIALGNEMYKERNTFLDYSTGVSMASRVVMLAMLGKKLLKKENKNQKNKENAETITPDKKAKVNKIIASAKVLGKYAPHVERVLALVRAGTKFGKLESGKVAQVCTLFITLCRAAQIAVETAESDSQILKAAPLVMVAITAIATVRDQFTDQAILKK